MKSLVLALALLAGLVSPASSAPWGYSYSPSAYDAQAQKARHGREQGAPTQGRQPPPERQIQGDPRRQQQLNDDERRALHRDLDKANRELYRRR